MSDNSCRVDMEVGPDQHVDDCDDDDGFQEGNLTSAFHELNSK